jgi:hypothetical protein
MPLGNIGPDITLPGQIRNSAFSEYVKSAISFPNFIGIVALIKMAFAVPLYWPTTGVQHEEILSSFQCKKTN